MPLYQVLTNITIQQIPTEDFPDRKLKIFINSLHSYSGSSSWEDLTQKMCIVLPKRTKYKAQGVNGDTYKIGYTSGSDTNIGGYVGVSQFFGNGLLNKPAAPTFMRGDMITFDIGWRTKLSNGHEITYKTGGPDPTGLYPTIIGAAEPGIPHLFRGFISKVNPRMPFTIECEDAMWLLRQIPTPTKQWEANETIQGIADKCIKAAYSWTNSVKDGKKKPILQAYADFGVILTVGDIDKTASTNLKFNVQNFRTRGENLRELLGRVKHQYKLDSWFRDYDLRIGLLHYVPSESKQHNFEFQKNILDGDKLHYERKDDRVLSCIVKSCYSKVSKTKHTKDGKEIATNASTEILVYAKAGQFTYISKTKGIEFPPNEEGYKFSFQVNDVITDEKKLFEIGVTYLKKYYYDGLKGSFSSFNIPFVKHGDTVKITNPLLPEMAGIYMVKAVYPNGGAEEGLRQEIHLDYRIDTVDNINTFSF